MHKTPDMSTKREKKKKKEAVLYFLIKKSFILLHIKLFFVPLQRKQLIKSILTQLPF